MTELEPIDETHRQCLETRRQIRQHVMLLKSRAASWQPGPCPDEWGVYQPSRHVRRHQ